MDKILLTDDDQALNQLLCEYLSSQGFDVDPAFDGEEALNMLKTANYDVLVLDVMMPKLDGMAALRKLRQDGSTMPVIMLTAQGDDVDRIVGLELGADDYIPKPCNPRELVARIRAVLRRTKGDNSSDSFDQGDLSIDGGSRKVSLAGSELELTSAEFDILDLLARKAGEVLNKDDIATHALGRTLGYNDRSLDMHISKLRRKLGALPDGGERIKTVRNRGYLYAKQ